jgi:hypothetical protein
MSELSSLNFFCVAGTSKKPPQVREFFGSGGDLRLDGVEHAAKLAD